MNNIFFYEKNESARRSDQYSTHARRAFNTIYYLLQYDINSGKIHQVKNSEYFDIEFSFFRKMMNLEKVESYIKEIQEALTELQEPIELHNFEHPQDSTVYDRYRIVPISEVRLYINEQGKRIASIALSPLIKWLMIHTNEGNFTKLELIPMVNKLRTKYAMKLYEFLKSFENYGYVDMHKDYLIKLLGLEHAKTYQRFFELKRLLNRQIKEITSKTDLKSPQLETERSQKRFIFYLDPNKTSKASEEDIQRVAEKLSNRFA